MTKTELTKAIVNNMTGYSIGAAVSMFLRKHRRHSDNLVIELAIDVATFVTVMAVSGALHKPVIEYTNEQIDTITEWIKEVKSRRK